MPEMPVPPLPPQRYFDLVNEILAGLVDEPPMTRAIRSYCLGLSGLYWERTGKVPPRRLMQALASCGSVVEGVLLIEDVTRK